MAVGLRKGLAAYVARSRLGSFTTCEPPLCLRFTGLAYKDGMRGEFDRDLRYCAACAKYVRYLLSIEKGFCVHCGGPVTLFSEDDHLVFKKSLETRPRPFRLDETHEVDQYA